jgi:hypothetical protein
VSPIPYDPRRIPGIYRIGRHIARNYGTRPNNRPLADPYTRKHECPCSDKYFVADMYRPGYQRQVLLFKIMRSAANIRFLRDYRTSPNLNPPQTI